MAPFVYTFHTEMGNTYREMNNKEMALKEYYESLKYNPFQYKIRESIREIENKKSLFDYLSEEDLYKIYKNDMNTKYNSSDNAVILLDQTNKVVYSRGASEERYYYLVKVLSSEGIDDFKEFNIFTYPNQDYIIEKAEVLKKEGDKLKAEVNKNEIVFTNLTVGDAILIVYKIQNFQFGSLSKHFYDKKYYDSYYPCLKNKFSMIINKNEKFDYKFSGSELEPVIQTVDDFNIYTWEQTNKKELVSEYYTPNFIDYIDVLDISTIKDWDFVSKWYFDIVNSKAKSTYETKEVIKELFPNGPPKEKLEAIKKIYHYITKNIRYLYVPFLQTGIIPRNAAEILNSKMGDCKDVSTLFVALCREINIDATWVLVSTKNHGFNRLPLPSINFNHCIASVEINNKKYYVELTSEYLPFGSIYDNLLNSLVLDINNTKNNNLFVLNPLDRIQNSIYRSIYTKFENESMITEVTTTRTGGLAESTRAKYSKLSSEEQKKDLALRIGGDYAQTSLEDLKFHNNFYETSDSCTFEYKFRVENAFESIGDLIAFKPPYIDGLSPNQALSASIRKYPFDLSEYFPSDSEYDELTIEIPKDMQISEKLDPINIKSDFGVYKLEFKLNDNKLVIKRFLKVEKSIIKSSEFPNLKKFFQQIYKSDSKQLAFKKVEEKPVKKSNK